MEVSAKIEGLDQAMKALQAAFPNNHKKQASILNGAMGASARKSFLPIARQMAKNGDSSGALSESLKVRAMPARTRRARGKAGGMQLMPVRYNVKAMAIYLNYYYTSQGKNPPLGGIDGIRHGHLVEFGTKNITASPFLWPAAASGTTPYRAMFAKALGKRIASAVKREAKKAKK
jgi:hypothetical protein